MSTNVSRRSNVSVWLTLTARQTLATSYSSSSASQPFVIPKRVETLEIWWYFNSLFAFTVTCLHYYRSYRGSSFLGATINWYDKCLFSRSCKTQQAATHQGAYPRRKAHSPTAGTLRQVSPFFVAARLESIALGQAVPSVARQYNNPALRNTIEPIHSWASIFPFSTIWLQS